MYLQCNSSISQVQDGSDGRVGSRDCSSVYCNLCCVLAGASKSCRTGSKSVVYNDGRVGVDLWNGCHCRTCDGCQAKRGMELLGQRTWIADLSAFLFPRGKHVRPMMECVGH
jgi:hypothetical protein